MDHTTMLTRILKLHFGWHLARIKCLSCLMIALFKVKTVKFAELATALSGSAQVDSHYRRLQRFFKEVSHCTGQKIKIADIFDKYDVLAPLAHSIAVLGPRTAPLACLVDLKGYFESGQIHSETRSWLDVDAF